jgi:hypothetical protein
LKRIPRWRSIRSANCCSVSSTRIQNYSPLLLNSYSHPERKHHSSGWIFPQSTWDSHPEIGHRPIHGFHNSLKYRAANIGDKAKRTGAARLARPGEELTARVAFE